MKKITLLLAALMASGAASAATQAILAPSTSVGNALCTLLNEDVKINLSSNVSGGISCDGLGIALAACHVGGRTATRTQPVTTCTNPADSTTCTTTDTSVTGAAVPYATTAKGTVTADYPGGACDAAGSKATAVAVKYNPK